MELSRDSVDKAQLCLLEEPGRNDKPESLDSGDDREGFQVQGHGR